MLTYVCIYLRTMSKWFCLMTAPSELVCLSIPVSGPWFDFPQIYFPRASTVQYSYAVRRLQYRIYTSLLPTYGYRNNTQNVISWTTKRGIGRKGGGEDQYHIPSNTAGTQREAPRKRRLWWDTSMRGRQGCIVVEAQYTWRTRSNSDRRIPGRWKYFPPRRTLSRYQVVVSIGWRTSIRRLS